MSCRISQSAQSTISQPCPSCSREGEGWEVPEGPCEEHKPIIRNLYLSEAKRRRWHEPDGAKQRRREEREWGAEWDETAMACDEAGFWPGVEVSRDGVDQRQQEQRGPQEPLFDLNSFEVRRGCSAPLASQTVGPDTRPAWLRCQCHAAPLLAAFLPAIGSRTWALLSPPCLPAWQQFEHVLSSLCPACRHSQCQARDTCRCLRARPQRVSVPAAATSPTPTSARSCAAMPPLQSWHQKLP